MGSCRCTSGGIACGDDAVEGHDFCGNCHDGACDYAAENDVACSCHRDADVAPDFFERIKQAGLEVTNVFDPAVPDERVLLEAQIVSLVRKHRALDEMVGTLDDTPGSAERRAAGAMLDAMSDLDEALFEMLYRWAE